MGEPQRADALVAKIEGILQKKRAGTEALREAWNDGRLTKPQLPCYDRCDGNILAHVDGHSVQGMCPVFMELPYCPLPTLHEREMIARLTRAGFGKQYHHPEEDRVRALSALQEYLAHLRANVAQGRGLILSGDVGVGKTMSLAFLARQMLEENVGVWKVHMPEFVESLADRLTRRTAVERAIKVQVLMIDDFGSGEMPTWVLGILEGIVEHRYAAQRPMIVSTNLDRVVLVRAPEFRRMVDRWREKCQFVGIGGESQRHAPEQG